MTAAKKTTKITKIAIGDVVEMKSGSPPMTVIGLNEATNQVTAVWCAQRTDGIPKIEQVNLPMVVLKHGKVKA